MSFFQPLIQYSLGTEEESGEYVLLTCLDGDDVETDLKKVFLLNIFVFLNLFSIIWRTTFFDNPIYQPLRSGRIWHKVNF